LAAVSASGAADTAWNPGADAAVASLVLSADGARLFAGGAFTAVGGSARSHLAAISTAAGAALDAGFNPGADADVLALSLDGARLYAAGSFSAIGGAGVRFVAALDAGTGAADPTFAAAASAPVRAVS